MQVTGGTLGLPVVCSYSPDPPHVVDGAMLLPNRVPLSNRAKGSMHKLVKRHWIWAIAFPLAAVWYGDLLWSLTHSRSFDLFGEIGPRLLRSTLAALPFILLAIGSKVGLTSGKPGARRGVAAAGITLMGTSVLVWGYVYLDALPGFRLLGPMGSFLLILAHIPISVVFMVAAFEIGRRIPTDSS